MTLQDQHKLMEQAKAARERALTPEQKQRRKEVDERAALIQAGIKPPKGNTFGGKVQ